MSSTIWLELRAELEASPRTWLVTGAAGFIGSHLVEELLRLGQEVLGLDNFSTGTPANLEDVQERVGRVRWQRFEFTEGDVRERETCSRLCAAQPIVLHQAALGSVPRSLVDPRATFASNVEGFFQLLEAARAAQVPRFTYASSSSVYGSDPRLPKVEEHLGEPLSPYAATKRTAEILACAAHRAFGQPVIGLRYFNVFGPRQDPLGPYAAVIPRWVETLVTGERPTIHGDGETSRDFCPVANVVQANLLAARAPESALGRIFNIALGRRTSLAELCDQLRTGLQARGKDTELQSPTFDAFRPGDVRHSLADISLARTHLGYLPHVDLEQGIALTLDWYLERG